MKTQLLVVAILVGMCSAQTAPPVQKPAPKYTPTKEQALELENAQLRTQLAQKDFVTAQRQLQLQYTLLNKECEVIVKANNWPETVTCNPDTLQFADSSAKKEEKK